MPNFRPVGALEVSNSYNGVGKKVEKKRKKVHWVISRVAPQLKTGKFGKNSQIEIGTFLFNPCIIFLYTRQHHYRNLTLPLHLEPWNFAQSFLEVYTCHSWCPKSSRLHSGINNVLQDSFEDALETQMRMSASSAPIGVKFCTELPWYLYLSFLTTKVIKTPIRYQEFPPRLLEGSSGSL